MTLLLQTQNILAPSRNTYATLSHNMPQFPGAIEQTIVVSGALLNCLLLFLIVKFSRKELGLYKYLLSTIALCDILMSLAHGITAPRAFLIEYTFAVTPHSLFVEPSRGLIIGYSSLFTLPFYIINIHFLYRYWSIKTPDRVRLFANKPFISLLIFIGAASIACWAGLMTLMGGVLATDEFSRLFFKQYDRTNEGAWVTMAYKTDSGQWNHLTIWLMVIFDGLAVGQCAVAISLSSLTFLYIHQATSISSTVKSRQRMLLMALCLQTAVPVICVYIPYLGLISSPILALDLGAFPDLCPVLIASFPAFDALVIMIVIKDYREGLLSACRPRKLREGDTQETGHHNDK